MGETLQLDLEGWEGPLDLLLTLARAQKVDLREISILALVDQYLDFLEHADAQLEVAADYLVMAAWLAYLKSCLLLPNDPEVVPGAEELALRLQLRLQRLEAMRAAGTRLMARDRIGRDVFLRGSPEGLEVVRRSAWQATLYDVIAGYAAVRGRAAPVVHVVAQRPVMTLEAALKRIEAMLGVAVGWTPIERFVPEAGAAAYRRSALASSFVAALELARQGRVALAQDAAFAPLLVKRA